MWALAALMAYQVVSGFHQAELIREQARLKKQVDDMNAEDAEIDAHNAEVYGFTESARYQSVVDQTVGSQRGIYAAQNVDVNYGTAAQKQEETKLTGYFNMLEMQRRAKERALGYKKEARNIRLGSGFSRLQSNMDANASINYGITSAMSTGVSGYARGSFGKTTTKKEGDTTIASTNAGYDSGTASQEFHRGNLAYDTTGIA